MPQMEATDVLSSCLIRIRASQWICSQWAKEIEGLELSEGGYGLGDMVQLQADLKNYLEGAETVMSLLLTEALKNAKKKAETENKD